VAGEEVRMSEASDRRRIRGLIVVDIQNDFCEGGSLEVSGGGEVARRVSRFLSEHAGEYESVIVSRDWHIDPNEHFAAFPDYLDTWPAHCVAGGEGAAFHPDLDLTSVDVIVSKGAYEAAYSAFDGTDEAGRPLYELLVGRGITEVDVVGIATDHCVRATALDAARAGFATRVLLSLCVGVAPETTAVALTQLASAGVELTGAADATTA
jgi:nicotinamidase/pyrazinamidase